MVRKTSLAIPALAGVLLLGFPMTRGNDNPAYLAVLDTQLEAQSGTDYHTMDRLIELRKSRKIANHELVDLLDYYLGAGAGEILDEMITSEGKAIAPLLEKKRNSPLKCLPQYRSICADDVEQRNRRIDGLLDAIEHGIVLKAAE